MSPDKKRVYLSLAGKCFIIFTLVFFFYSCRTEQIVEESLPPVEDEIRDEGDFLFFSAKGTGFNEEEAMDDLARNMADIILQHMGLNPSDFSQNLEEKEYLNRLMNGIIGGNDKQTGLTLDEKSWFKEGDLLEAKARLKYDKGQYEQDKSLLQGYLSGDEVEFNYLLVRSEELYDQGFPFSSFLLSMDGSELGFNREGLLSGFMIDKALKKALFYLKRTTTPQLVGPDQIYLGARRSWPFITNMALASLENRTVSWRVEYSQPQRGGEPKSTTIQLPSDTEGTARFFYPFPTGEGEGRISFNLQIPALSVLRQSQLSLIVESLDDLERELSRFNLFQSFPVKKDRSVLRTGLVIDDKDVAGKRLLSRVTEKSVLSLLIQEGYPVEILEFDLTRLQDKSRLDILREFNSQYGNDYDIILYSEAAIQGFTKKGELYQMTAGAILYEVDLWEHRVNEIGRLNSSVTGGDPARLVTSAFVQLGNDIARTCIELNKNQEP